MKRPNRYRPTFTETRTRRPLMARITPLTWMIVSILLLLFGIAGATMWRSATGVQSVTLSQRLATATPVR
jgi:hypothetical protein